MVFRLRIRVSAYPLHNILLRRLLGEGCYFRLRIRVSSLFRGAASKWRGILQLLPLLSSYLLALIVFSVRCFCFMRCILFWSPIQTLTPPNRAYFQWTSVLQSCQMLRGHAETCGAWKEVYQHVSPEASVSHFPFIFFNLSGFSTLLVITCLLRLFTQDFYHGTTMINNTKTISCTVRATYYGRTGLFRRTNVWGPVSQRASSGMTS